MGERYLDLARIDRRKVLDLGASASGRPGYLLEKGVWVVWSLKTLCAAPLGDGAPVRDSCGTMGGPRTSVSLSDSCF